MQRHLRLIATVFTLQAVTANYAWQKVARSLILLTCIAPCLQVTVARGDEEKPLHFEVDDRIAIVGNGLADRMQHDGWLEAYLQARLPEHRLVVRNLGFTGDQLTIRLRSAGFGSPADWLKRTDASVVFAFFGYNESFAGPAGLKKFKRDLREFVTATRKLKDGSDKQLRLILFSPAAYEDLSDPNLPPAVAVNQRLEMYSAAMAEVGAQLDVPFVDLFHGSLAELQSPATDLTINGVHFNESGNHAVAKLIDQAFFGELNKPNENALTKLREAICDKNFYWFQRYRTTDGYSIFGGRKGTGGSKWTPNNEKVMQREMEVLDTQTANRDRRIWAIAQGSDLDVDDSNLPEQIPVASNKPGPLGDGSYPFLGGEEAIERMTVDEGLAVNLFASEEQFPELQNPVQAAVDTKGRLWVAAWPSYPHWRPTDEMNDKLLIFEDTDGDGRADKCKVFADGLHNPTGFEFYNGGVYVAQVPDIWFLKDTDGDDVADVRQRVLGGIDSADTHHSINSFVLGPGGGIHFQEGLFHRTQIETPHGPPVRVKDACVFRYDPVDQSVIPYANYGFANPHGHAFTYWGDDIIHDGTSAVPMFGPAISGRTIYPGKHRGAPPIYDRRTRPCSATAILSSSHFPEKYRGDLLVCNVIGEQGVLRYKLKPSGSGIRGVEAEPFVMSTDPNFRPVDLEVGADGAVYVLDWQNPLIGHLQHNLRDSNRDHRHGRIYRFRHKGRELLDNPPIADQPLEIVFDLLTYRDNSIRYRAKIELSRHPTSEVVAACRQWIDSLDPQTKSYEHHLLEALWVHQHHHSPNESLLRQLLDSSKPRVRTAAAHVLRAWRTDINDSESLIERLIADSHPRVRLAGVLICSDLEDTAAAELALQVAKQPSDKFLDYALLETIRTLAPQWKATLASGKPFCADNPEAMSYLLRCSSPAEMLKIVRSEQLLTGLAAQASVDPGVRFNIIKALAKKRKTSPLQVVVDTIESLDDTGDESLDEIVALLGRFDQKALDDEEDRFVKLATNSSNEVTRQGALAALATLDASPGRVWELVGDSAKGLADLLGCIKRVPNGQVRESFYDRVRPIMLKHTQTPAVSGSNASSELAIKAIQAMGYIPGNETERLNDLVMLLESNQHRPFVVTTIAAIPTWKWDAEFATRLVKTTTDFLGTVDASERASGNAYKELQLALKAADLLPQQERSAAMSTLKGFAVRVLRVATIPHRMSYDQQKLAVQAGEPVQLVFENPDNMPHNLVIVRPGTLAKIGLLAETEATQPDAIARQYVPSNGNVLHASKLLQPQQSDVLNFRAPQVPGVYPFVCTYPGHWRRMFGALYVVADVDDYEADPVQYLANESIEPQDEFLKFNRPLHNWTFAELAPALDRLGSAQSFDQGSRLFQAASCAACHSVPEGGARFAPDLTKLDAKRTPSDILRSIVEPSHKIEKDYQMSKFLLDSGKVVVGLRTEETADKVTLMIDPLVSCIPTILAEDEIEERYESDISLMPAGLLDRFTEDEILELCAFVVARGDRTAPIYQQDESN